MQWGNQIVDRKALQALGVKTLMFLQRAAAEELQSLQSEESRAVCVSRWGEMILYHALII